MDVPDPWTPVAPPAAALHSLRVGGAFCCRSAFSRACRRIVGVSPGAVRKEPAGGSAAAH